MLAGSGHIAGVINPPAKKKYQYWTGEAAGTSLEDWMANASAIAGSWWPDWTAWLAAYSGVKVPARDPSLGPLKPIEQAPGSYVQPRTVRREQEQPEATHEADGSSVRVVVREANVPGGSVRVFDDGSIEHQTGAGTKWYRNFAELERSLRASIGVNIGNGDGHGGDARVTAPTTPVEEVPVNQSSAKPPTPEGRI